MAWQPVLVGVDTSREAARAAALGLKIAEAAGTACRLVHAVPEAWTVAATMAAPDRAREFSASLIADARQAVLGRLAGGLTTGAAEGLMVEPGKAPVVLRTVATRLGAEVIVIGGKHHSVVDRWIHGSTAQTLMRTASVPILVAAAPALPRRILVAVDLSPAARPTIEAAQRYAALSGAMLRALSVVEPLPALPEVPVPYRPDQYYEQATAALEQRVWAELAPSIERVARYGMAVETILREAHEWAADLLVVGSHGRGWAERVLVGSVTERLLNHLPTSVLVVPAYATLALHGASAQAEPERQLALV